MMNTRVSIWQKALRMVLALALAARPRCPSSHPTRRMCRLGRYYVPYHQRGRLGVRSQSSAIPRQAQSINIVLDNDDSERSRPRGCETERRSDLRAIDLPAVQGGAFDGRGHTITGLEYNRDLCRWTQKRETPACSPAPTVPPSESHAERCQNRRGLPAAACWWAARTARASEASPLSAAHPASPPTTPSA